MLIPLGHVDAQNRTVYFTTKVDNVDLDALRKGNVRVANEGQHVAAGRVAEIVLARNQVDFSIKITDREVFKKVAEGVLFGVLITPDGIYLTDDPHMTAAKLRKGGDDLTALRKLDRDGFEKLVLSPLQKKILDIHEEQIADGQRILSILKRMIGDLDEIEGVTEGGVCISRSLAKISEDLQTIKENDAIFHGRARRADPDPQRATFQALEKGQRP